MTELLTPHARLFNGAPEGSWTATTYTDGVRVAVDLRPTQGVLPTHHALTEYVLYRTPALSGGNDERLNFSAHTNGTYRIGQEATGTGVIRDVDFATENGVEPGTEVYLRVAKERAGNSQPIALRHGHLRFDLAGKGGYPESYYLARGGGETLTLNVPAAGQFLGLVDNDPVVSWGQAGLQLRGEATHGMTAIAPVDAYGLVSKRTQDGGLSLVGLTGGQAQGLFLQGIAASEDVNKDAGAVGHVMVVGSTKNGTGQADMSPDANVLVVRNRTTTSLIVSASGDIHVAAGLHPDSWDEHDDALLGRALRAATLPEGHPIRERFGYLAERYRGVLEQSGLVTFNADGRHFVNATRLGLFLTDAVWQLGERLSRLERSRGYSWA